MSADFEFQSRPMRKPPKPNKKTFSGKPPMAGGRRAKPDSQDSARPFDPSAAPKKGPIPKPEKPSRKNRVKYDDQAPRPPKFEDRAPRPPKFDDRGPRPSKFEDKPARKPKAAPKPVEESVDEIQELVTFAELDLIPTVLKSIMEMGFEVPTPIQAKSIPVLMSGRDMIGQAQTGTGKTAAFAIPLIQRIDPDLETTQALVLAPTRELAVQVAGGIHDLAKHTGLRVVPVYGGQPIDRQFRALRNGAQVVVGTPGRILDHLRRGSLDISNVSTCVLDEADEMLALGFAEDLDAILGQLPTSRQLVFFSATMPPKILHLTKKFLNDPVHVQIQARQRTVDTTNQTYYEVPPGKKLDALARVLDMETPGPTIVFCRTRQATNDLSENLRLRGYAAEALHGDMNQAERDRVMRRFRDGAADLLVATDVAARGLDIDTVTHVINYDIPWDVEQYIHRIGRTGRAGRSGDAITLVSGKERGQLRNIERMIGSTIKAAKIPTAADISSKRREVFVEGIREVLESGAFENQLRTVSDLSEEWESAEVAAAALHLLWMKQNTSKEDAADSLTHDFEQPEMGMARVFVGMGRQDGLRPADLVGAITNEVGLSGKQIGVIDILDRTSFVEVPVAEAQRVVEILSNVRMRNRRITVNLVNGPGGGDRGMQEEEQFRGPRRPRKY